MSSGVIGILAYRPLITSEAMSSGLTPASLPFSAKSNGLLTYPIMTGFDMNFDPFFMDFNYGNPK
jgi:hypothetical protein